MAGEPENSDILQCLLVGPTTTVGIRRLPLALLVTAGSVGPNGILSPLGAVQHWSVIDECRGDGTDGRFVALY